MTIILSGTIGRSGLGGQAWACLQYLLGFRALGHEVYYLEDCGKSSWVYVWETEEWTHELDYPSQFVQSCLTPFGLGDRWIYRDNYRSLGVPLETFVEVCRGTDLLLLRAAPFWNWRPEYEWPRRRAFLDVDPGFTQITLANGDAGWVEGVNRCERRLTVGMRMGRADCLAPTTLGPWLSTPPTVYLPEWPRCHAPATHLTSVIRWQGFKNVAYQGVGYGQRDLGFVPFLELPRRTDQPFRLAQMGADRALLTEHGWDWVPGEVISRTPQSYRAFIQESRAEFSVPKQGYVAMRGGWFSDRSVCYLASGRPVLMQDTGLEDWVPVGKGLLTFDDAEGALAAIQSLNLHYADHQLAARELAENVFATDKVLPKLLEDAMG